MMERIKKIVHKNKEILIIDYSNCKEPDMIELARAAKELILKENKKVLILNKLNDKTYATPKFIRFIEEGLREVEELVVKNAVTGISTVQQWIVKGINLWYKNKLHPFNTVDEALDFLVS